MTQDEKLPGETYESLLRHGESHGLPLQAYEVAEIKRSIAPAVSLSLALVIMAGLICVRL